jgi:antitoxin component YwqK of YwqJK toxin-antitoxin module
LSISAQIAYNKTDAKGLKTGPWHQYHKNGKIRYTGQFKAGVPVDTFRYYSDKEKITSIVIHKKNGYSAAYIYYDGQLLKAMGGFHNQKKDGLWKYYSLEQVLVTEESFKDSIKDGPWRIFYSDGKLASESYWKMGKMEGCWKEYFENGTLKLNCNYINDQLHGDYQLNYINGNPIQKGKYIFGLKDGQWISYEDNGKISKIETYIKGYLKREEIYTNGVKTKTIEH